MDWISETLKERVCQVFQPKYDSLLSDTEICNIAENLTSLIEAVLVTGNKYESTKTYR